MLDRKVRQEMIGNGSTVGTAIVKRARIVVADEQAFLREGLKQFLNRHDDLGVCAEADDVRTLMLAAEAHSPDLLILEMRLRNGDVLELLKALRTRFPAVRLLVHTLNDENFYAERALRAGAHGYIMKQEQPQEVLAAVRKVLKGELYLSRQMSSTLLSRLLQSPASTSTRPLDGLSDREFQVFHMLGAGMVNRQIALKLNLSVKTIETYRENIKHKFGYRTAAELLRHAAQWMQHEGRASINLTASTTITPSVPAFALTLTPQLAAVAHP